jgi:hypothetical protein
MLAWFEKDPAQARLILQLTLNSLMIAGVLVLHASPWLTLAWLLVLFALACVLHGSGAWQLLGIFGILGWVGEAWLVGFGAVWAFQIPAQSLMQGGLFGVPFYMAPAWALVGALMLVLDGVFRPRARSG